MGLKRFLGLETKEEELARLNKEIKTAEQKLELDRRKAGIEVKKNKIMQEEEEAKASYFKAKNTRQVTQNKAKKGSGNSFLDSLLKL